METFLYIAYLFFSIILCFIVYLLFCKFFEIVKKLDNYYDKTVQERKDSFFQQTYNQENYTKYKYTTEKNNNKKDENSYKKQHSTETINKEKTNNDSIPDCLTILGFTKYPNSIDEIKSRYKKLTKIYHPDEGGTKEEFDRICKAYQESLSLDIYKNTKKEM